MVTVRIVMDGGKPVAQVVDDSGKVSAATLELPKDHAVEDVSALRNAFENERDKRLALSDKLKRFDGLDDPQAARDALEKMREGKVKSASEIEEYRAKIEAKFAADRQKVEAELDSLRKENHQLTFGADAAAAIAKFRGNQMFLMPILEKRVRYARDESGKMSCTVLDETGKQMVTRRSGSTEPMGLEEFVGLMAEDKQFSQVFEGRGVAGGSSSSPRTAASGAADGGENRLRVSHDPEASLATYYQATQK